MSTLRELKRRIKSVTSTRQMTQAMKMVSVSKYNRALARCSAFEPYEAQCRRLIEAVGGGALTLPRDREVKSVCYVVLTGNRGLCGDYNQVVLRLLRETLQTQTLPYQVLICGRWGHENAPDIPHETIELDDIPTWEQSGALARRLLELFRSGQADEIYFVYQRFINVLTRQPCSQRFLPQEEASPQTAADYLFEPDREALLNALLERCLFAQVYGLLLSAATGFHGAMMMTMRSAADNSQAMLESLSLTMNRLRQSSVTTQVLEISSAAMQEENL